MDMRKLGRPQFLGDLEEQKASLRRVLPRLLGVPRLGQGIALAALRPLAADFIIGRNEIDMLPPAPLAIQIASQPSDCVGLFETLIYCW